MPTPEIEAYLAARATYEAAMANWHRARRAGEPLEDIEKRLDLLNKARFDALRVLVPVRLQPVVDVDWFEATDALCDEFVWFPLLVAEYDGDREAGEVAWALGGRPPGYPKEAK